MCICTTLLQKYDFRWANSSSKTRVRRQETVFPSSRNFHGGACPRTSLDGSWLRHSMFAPKTFTPGPGYANAFGEMLCYCVVSNNMLNKFIKTILE